ncbi:LacI family DNA-binding transcriptional regulator [Arsenicicoccus sp. oral taxon 190]|uniref:LacI family DNA-binding transcriptional regulator n=1 Tax=Arsenicicoccus sp. oral taxon 190 TaxID=1658671 RepID=UPI00155DD216|nr:LacI family DNA-binding transcriptional regulator [Arsenicicoccus sp. oral taxon 190]
MAPQGLDRRPTLADVGRMAGVSPTTVSFVLNPRSKQTISAATRARVLQAVNDLGYRPNRTAQSLRRSRTGTIGIVVDEPAMEAFAGETVNGAHDLAWSEGSVLLVTHTGRRPHGMRLAMDELADRQVDGLIVTCSGTRALELPETLPPLPLVLANAFDDTYAVPCFLPDERFGGRETARLLCAAGHRRLAYLTGHAGAWATSLRLEGFLEEVEQHGVARGDVVVREGYYYVDSGHALARELLALPDATRPTAIACGNDRMALGVYLAAAEAGLRIPEDLSVVGYDDHEPVITQLRPQLTTVRLPLYDMGRLAAEALAHGSVGQLPQRTYLPCPAVPRDSVAAAPGRHTDGRGPRVRETGRARHR